MTIKLICEYCGKKYLGRTRKRINKHHFCSQECHYNYKRESKEYKGNNNPRYKKIELVCEYCGKTIYKKASSAKRCKHHFCSRECHYKYCTVTDVYKGENNPNWKGRKVEVICDYCGKKCFRYGKRREDKHHFCSRDCRYNYRVESGGYRGENSPAWKGGKAEWACDYCKRKYLVYVCQIKKSKHHFCSKECANKYRLKTDECKGKNNPRWNKIELTCEYCGKKFFRSPSLIKNKHHFCSKECANKYRLKTDEYRGKNNPRWNQFERTCLQCGKKFYRNESQIKKGGGKYCSKECFLKSRNTIESSCMYCGKLIKRKQNEIKNGRRKYCSKTCMAKAYSEFDQYKGENNNYWKGGWFPYYGKTWPLAKRKALKRAKHVSEINGSNDKLQVHHIIPLRKIVEKYFNLCLNPYIKKLKYPHLKLLPYDLIPDLIFEEANHSDNLICLTNSEHKMYEGMPLSFFDAILK